MIDREKVIGGLAACTGEPHDCAGHTCPYFDFDDSEVDYGCRVQMELDALALLKEQEAVKPVEREYKIVCGMCHEKLVEIDGDCEVLWSDNFAYPNYCPNCGRPVKWNERSNT